jgi:hypothetical protein
MKIRLIWGQPGRLRADGRFIAVDGCWTRFGTDFGTLEVYLVVRWHRLHLKIHPILAPDILVSRFTGIERFRTAPETPGCCRSTWLPRPGARTARLAISRFAPKGPPVRQAVPDSPGNPSRRKALDDTAHHRVVISLQAARSPAGAFAEKIPSEIKARYTSASPREPRPRSRPWRLLRARRGAF